MPSREFAARRSSIALAHGSDAEIPTDPLVAIWSRTRVGGFKGQDLDVGHNSDPLVHRGHRYGRSMPSYEDIIAAAPWLPPSIFSLVGVLVGATLTWLIQRTLAKRSRRSDLALSTLEELTTARSLVTQRRAEHGTRRTYVQPLLAPEVATALWVRFEMLAALERRSTDQNGLAANGMTIHEWLMAGAQTESELEDLGVELQRLTVLLLALERPRTRGRARGRDFRLPADEAFQRFGPRFTDADLPPLTPRSHAATRVSDQT